MKLYYPEHLLSASRWCAVAFAFFIPISTALMNLSVSFAILFLGLSGAYGRSYKANFGNRFVLAALLLFALFALGVLYSSSGYETALARLSKYAKLLFPALLFPLFLNSRVRETAIYSFLGAMTLVLITIYAMLLGLVDESVRGDGSIIRHTIDGGFKTRIITSILVAFSAYGFAILSGRVGRLKPLFWLLAALAVGYVLVFSSGLTGRLILFALIGLTIVQTVGMKRGVVIFLLGTVVALPAMYFGSDSFRGRIENIRNIHTEVNEGPTSSVQQRLAFLERGIELVRSRPLFGHGTGAVVEEDPLDPGGKPVLLNLHNQYLMVWSEAGIVGLGLLLYLFYIHWRLSSGLPERERKLSQGVVVTVAVGCLFNSLLMDSGESHFYLFFATLFLSRLADGDAEVTARSP